MNIIEDKYKESRHLVAFIDILGSSELIKSLMNSVNIIHSAYDIALNSCSQLMKTIDSSNKYSSISAVDIIKTKIFSDNIVVYAKLDDYSDLTIGTILISFLMEVQYFLLK